MGAVLEKLFVEPKYFGFDADGNDSGEPYAMIQLLFYGGCYAYILMQASGMIGDGSELLLLTPFRGLIGSVVLPVLGAVPDGAIILFSGTTQKELAVGVGALAGSTIMLLTIPWALAIIGGRVDLNDDGTPNYKKKPRLTPGQSMLNSGASVDSSIRLAGITMGVTSLTYLMIQIPALKGGCGLENCGCPHATGDCIDAAAAAQSPWALYGLVVASVLLVAYIALQYCTMDEEDPSELARRYKVLMKLMQQPLQLREMGALRAMLLSGVYHEKEQGDGESARLLDDGSKYTKMFDYCMERLFSQYDCDSNNFIDSDEVVRITTQNHFAPELSRALTTEASKTGLTLDQLKTIMWQWAHTPISSAEREIKLQPPPMSPLSVVEMGPLSPTQPRGALLRFEDAAVGAWVCMAPQGAPGRFRGQVVRKYQDVIVLQWCTPQGMGPDQWSVSPTSPTKGAPSERAETRSWWESRGYPQKADPPDASSFTDADPAGQARDDEHDREDKEEDEEMPDDIRELPAGQQQCAIWRRALTLMGIGTVLVLLFSDPLVGILSAIGDRCGIPAFYISFVLAPLASNGTELLCAYNYAVKKTENMMTTALSTLLGAACMNNTFCLAIFLLQIWKNRFVWTFTAETASIFTIELLMLIFAMVRVQKPIHAFFIVVLFPLSIFEVYALERWGGLD